MTILTPKFADKAAMRASHHDAINILTSAFIADPVIRWMYPTASEYFSAFPKFLEAFGGIAFDEGTVALGPDLRSAAMWIAPGLSPDAAAIKACLLETVAAEKHTDLFAMFEDMGSAHPEDGHWYLPWLGVDASSQNAGFGGTLIEVCLKQIESENMPIYLETPNPKNIPFYERYGFVVTGRCQYGDCPPVTFMLRETNSRHD